jgi:hypothetical protein
MRKGIRVLAALLVMMQLLWAQQPMSITRVLLYKNGMAYVVRSGQITAPVSLTFHPEDMNDVLKSFTAWNPTTGTLYSTGYTTGIPSSRALSRFPFDLTNAETGLGAFLVQVKGAEVRLDNNGKDIQGKLVTVQQAEHATAPQTSVSDYRLTILMKDNSLQSAWLSDVRSVEFIDPQLREQLRSYLDVLASGRQDVTREVTVYPVPAAGPIEVAYLQQFPLWKTSYRVDLGTKDSKIQGWAQVDNPTGESWDNVQLSLLSGAPVSFVMNLYDPLYTNRATVPVPGGQVAAPRQYESAVSTVRDGISVAEQRAAAAFPPPPAAAAPAGARGGAPGGGGGAGGRGGGGGVVGGVVVGLPSAPAFQQATGTQVEDFFEYQFPFPVRLASRQSALLPFLQKTMNIERLSIFNARSDRGNPRLGARLENNTDIPFEAGPVTFFQDTRYTGEAVLDYMPRGDKRLVSYGVDYDIQIANKQQSQPETTARLTISKGVAVLFMESVLTTTYEIRNKGTERKTLVVEHPRLNDRKLRNVEPFETTDSFYRFRVALNPGQSTEFAVPETVSRQTNVTLTSLTRPQLTLFAGRETPQNVRERLGQIIDTQEQIAAMRADLTTTQSGIETLFRDQERLRENIKALRDTSEDQQLRTRYLDQLKKQEDQIDASRARVDTVNKNLAAAQARLSDLISNLSFGN